MYCIPDLYLDAHIADIDISGAKLNSESGLMICLESALGESKQETWFSDT